MANFNTHKHTRSIYRVRARVPIGKHLAHVLFPDRFNLETSQDTFPHFVSASDWSVRFAAPISNVKCIPNFIGEAGRHVLYNQKESIVQNDTLKHITRRLHETGPAMTLQQSPLQKNLQRTL